MWSCRRTVMSGKQACSTWMAPARRRAELHCEEWIGAKWKVRATVLQWQPRELAWRQGIVILHGSFTQNRFLFSSWLMWARKPLVKQTSPTKKINQPQCLSSVFNQNNLGCPFKRTSGILFFLFFFCSWTLIAELCKEESWLFSNCWTLDKSNLKILIFTFLKYKYGHR